MVKKIQKLTNKKVQLILTDKPKLIYVDPAKLIVKGNIIWSNNPNDLSIQVTSSTHFKIVTVLSLSLSLSPQLLIPFKINKNNVTSFEISA